MNITKGPWRIEPASNTKSYCLDIYGNGYWICSLAYFDGEIEKANARAIAEVPAMLEALEIAAVLIKTAREYFPKSVKNTDRFNLETANAAITSILKRIEG